MGYRHLFLCALVFLFVATSLAHPKTRTAPADKDKRGSVGGGVACVGCNLIVSLLDQVSLVHHVELDDLVKNVCNYFPVGAQQVCKEFISTFGDAIITLLLKGVNPDDVCNTVGICTLPECRLWSQNSNKNVDLALEKKKFQELLLSRNMATETPWEWLLNAIAVLTDKHEPLADFDSDLFSGLTDTLRGAYWRGRDCDDLNSKVYPGRIETSPTMDQNCNGITGVDPATGRSYEDLFCKDTQPRGVAILGDSATAHFHIPKDYMYAPAITTTTYNRLLDILANEFDWPQQSWGTGHLNGTVDNSGPTDSLYLRMFQRNRCAHRDYQNIGVNGAGTNSMSSKIENSLKRNPQSDLPLLVVYALIGNDVCHPAHDLGAMTTPEKFRQNVMNSLSFFEQNLPAGSNVLFLGLVDGRILWNTLHNNTHPIGTTYARMYEYLNCLQVNPCWAWLNSNETIRNAGSARAAELNAVYVDIVKNYSGTFKNFDIAYMDFPLPAVIKIWTSKGGKVADLIEPIDGFHPSQIANSLFADVIWEFLEQNHPSFLGPVNPNNDKIASIFGDQGGY